MSQTKITQRFFASFFGFAALASILVAEASATQLPLYTEPHRPGFHYSPAVNWTNEPNGLVYKDGLYHMFYQANPFDNQFGNQSWGHATSSDLVHWEQRPVAIPAENGIMSFSGSAVNDVNNTSGLGTGGSGPLVAMYTGFIPNDGTQDQRLAFSNDNGVTWTKYSGNPVIPRLPGVEGIESRDPKVFWHEPTERWNMIMTHGGQKKASIWNSTDLKSWTRTQNFRANDIAGQIGGWEVPDMFPLPVKDSSGAVVDEKWVISTTPSTGSPAGGNGVNYFVGEFDGSTFTNENPLGTPLWADFGRDFDGQQSWSHDPQGRVIWTSIMQSYGGLVPTTPWRGQMALPRELSLLSDGGATTLVQQPIAELQSLRGPGTFLNNVSLQPNVDPLDGLNIEGDMLEIIATFDPQFANTVGFRVREGNGQHTEIGYDFFGQEMFVDRRFTGNTTYAGGAGGIHDADLSLENGLVKLHAFVDRNSVEVFGNDGRAVISDLIFPDPANRDVSIFATGSGAELVSLEIYPLSSIWEPGPQPLPGSSSIVRWSMNASPQAVGVPWPGPVSIDSRTRMGEGSLLGTTNPSWEPEPAVDNLMMVGETSMTTSTNVPPTSMFTLGNDGGTESFDASSIRFENNRALHLPNNEYGNELAFTDAFSVEMFFQTDGNQSGSGNMQLLLQGNDSFRYSIIVNEGGPGNVRFALNDKVGTIPVLDINSISARNFADGEWHYLLATYDPSEGTNGEMSLTITNEDGSAETVTIDLATAFPSFQGLLANSDGDLLVGRHHASLASDPRTFLGLIDEVQFTSGIVPDTLRLGALPGDDFVNGDFDRDGDVDDSDRTIWQAFYGTSSEARLYEGDADFDGDVDGNDLLTWQRNYTGSLPVSASSTVPEPTSIALTAVTLFWCYLYQHRNISHANECRK